MSSEALTALRRSRSQCFRARDAEGLRAALSQAAALWEQSPEPGLDTLIAALEQNILVLGGDPGSPVPPPVAAPAPPQAAAPESPQPVVVAQPHQPAPVSEPVVFEYAGWGRRFGAWFVDGTVIAVPLLVYWTVVGLSVGDGELPDWVFLAAFALVPAYFTLLHGRWGRWGSRCSGSPSATAGRSSRSDMAGHSGAGS